jgi:GNAT superfamily N-acetyltransferase
MRPDDIPAGLRLCREANWNQVAADWELLLASSPDGCRVAIDGADKVIGSVATIRYGDDFSWIAMVLVDPPHRGKGIGRQLLKEALDVIGEATTARLDATPAGRAVYVPLGFREEYGLQRMERPATVRLCAAAREMEASPGETRRSLGAGGNADTTDDGVDVDTNIGTNSGSVRLQPDRVVRPMSDADFADVVKHDRDVFGADRRVLLEMCRREAPEYAWAIGDGAIDGYLFGRRGYSFEQLGPLVARDESMARVLAAACLSAHADRAFIIDTPICAPWIAWLVSAGFTLQRPFTRMHRGNRPFRERLDQMFAIAGPEFG